VFLKKNIIVILMSGLFLFISAPISNADVEGVDGVVPLISASAAVSGLLGVDSGIEINTDSLVVEPSAYTINSFDAALSPSLVLDPESYVLPSTGILLQAQSEAWGSRNQEDNSFTTLLTNLVNAEQVISVNTGSLTTVMDAAGLSFNFTAPDGDNTVSLDFILASGEYYGGDWDIAGIFINGVNYAFLPNDYVLRVNTEAQITNVCSSGYSSGCEVSDYSVNGEILGTISPKLTLYAPIANGVNTFSASVANTDDTVLGSYLLLSNFNSFETNYSIGADAFTTFEGEILDFGIQLDEGINVSPSAPSVPSPRIYSEPNQSSEITSISISTADANNVTIIVTGKFIEKVLAIDVNDRRVLTDAWEQTSTSITLTVPAVASGIYAVQIWNGSFPTLQSQTVLVTTK